MVFGDLVCPSAGLRVSHSKTNEFLSSLSQVPSPSGGRGWRLSRLGSVMGQVPIGRFGLTRFPVSRHQNKIFYSR